MSEKKWAGADDVTPREPAGDDLFEAQKRLEPDDVASDGRDGSEGGAPADDSGPDTTSKD